MGEQKRVLVVMCLFAVLSCAWLKCSIQQNPSGREGFFCVATGAETLGYYRHLFPLLKDAGSSFVRIFPEWATIQPEQGTWNFELADSVVKAARENELQILGIFLYLAPWASSAPSEAKDPIVLTRTFPIKDINYWRNYVRGVVSRYRNEVKFWEVYNEFGSFSINGTPKDYAQLVQSAYEVAKEVDPQCRVGMGWNEFDLSSLRQVIEQGASMHFDFVTVHPYAMLDRVMKGREEAFLGMTKNFRKMLKLTGQRDDIPLWVTEIGYPAREGDLNSELKQAEALLKAYILCSVQGIEKVFWFEGRGPYYGEGGSFGLIRWDWTKRPSFRAFKTLTEQLGPKPKYLGWLELVPEGRFFVFEGRKGWVLVGWANSEDKRVKLPSGVKVFDLKGDPIHLDRNRELVVTTSPFFITDIPQLWVIRALRNGSKPFPWLKDHSNAKEVRWKMVQVGKDLMDGLFLTNPEATQVVEVEGVHARRTDRAKKAFYLEFDVDDSFVSVSDNSVEVTVIARRLDGNQPEGTGCNLIYESLKGYRHIEDWWTIPSEPGWHQYTFRIKDANFANCWGWNFCVSVVASPGDIIVKEVIVRK